MLCAGWFILVESVKGSLDWVASSSPSFNSQKKKKNQNEPPEGKFVNIVYDEDYKDFISIFSLTATKNPQMVKTKQPNPVNLLRPWTPIAYYFALPESIIYH